jgi:hypothetical protein
VGWQPIASIIHLSDLHLYADPDLGSADEGTRAAARRRFKKKVWLAKRLGGLVGLDKLEICNTGALAALEEALSDLGRNRPDLGDQELGSVVLHTGDVETLGPRLLSDGTAHFDGYRYLHERVRADLMGGVQWIDVFGNHDVWGGAWPLFERLSGLDEHSDNFDRIRAVEGLDSYQGPIQLDSQGPTSVLVQRVNTIDFDFVDATFAWGKVGSHPVGATIDEACADLQSCWDGPDESHQVRIVAMHHPPHAFAEGWWLRRWFVRHVGAARLVGSEQLSRAIQGKVQLVLAGHRHKPDPAEGVDPPFEQPPLDGAETVQLVAPSPTASKHLAHFDPESPDDQRSAREEMAARAFPRYELELDDDPSPRLRVWRTLHRLDSDTQTFLDLVDGVPGEWGQRSSTPLPRQLMLDVSL